ncbi:AI-2E family transporter [Tunturiibacter empetritectus]|uniref:AI-2E family transporter n=1 Tax=Tunturiibacter empetritectus TaxID=3069691 RepID=UPI003D9BF8A2
MSRARTTEIPRVEPLLVFAVIVLILYFARELLIPLTFALTLSFLLAPAVSRLELRRVPRVLAVAIIGILAFLSIFSVGYVVARQLLNVARTLPAYRLNIHQKMATVHSPAEQSLEKAFTAVEDISGDIAPPLPRPSRNPPYKSSPSASSIPTAPSSRPPPSCSCASSAPSEPSVSSSSSPSTSS